MRDDIIDTLEHYVGNRRPTGDFVRAVLENDLLGAFERADNINKHDMLWIVSYVYNHVPSCAWGSKQRVKDWLDRKDQT